MRYLSFEYVVSGCCGVGLVHLYQFRKTSKMTPLQWKNSIISQMMQKKKKKKK
ncbi:hypothetical protein M441DRAFT_296429 [Trichoderma asperellum CBS 433.97]|uniref:Uncharacterized protein n=1 Tax=Trichoderma asperellum (strain ATCC 204424 / CBS 433.97 / NBRC 101777) TaxID=1042311 RepID=A0A2T3YSX8_TRIA4|nr:hypothetical protein M441DRAFT_296429 [Trichoderma asperellum CBS 433.97]PTB35606.1 hypothetical protein M441DRAFT_296429 [Trichoderma asperellum CBS 433.97]